MTSQPGASQTPSWPYTETTLVDGSLVLQRFATDYDTAALFAALDNSQVWAHSRVSQPVNAAELKAQLINKMVCRRAMPWVIFREGKVVGTVALFPLADGAPGVEIGGLHLVPEIWGLGVGRQVVVLLSALAKKHGAQWVDFRVDEFNRRGIRFLKALGVIPTGVREEPWVRADGTRRISKLFRLWLSPEESAPAASATAAAPEQPPNTPTAPLG